MADSAQSQGVWRLLYQGVQVAELAVDDSDFPWLHAKVIPGPDFESLRPLFADEVRQIEFDDEAWAVTYEKIRRDFTLIDLEGVPAAEFLLHIDGDRAWWRWSDTPFET